MFRLLFSPDGRIFPEEFRKGAIVLLAFNFVLWLTWYTSLGLALLASIVALASIYCWACLFIKRLHDGGKTGLLFIPILIGFIIAAYLIVPTLVALILPENEQALTKALELKELQESLGSGANADPEDVREFFGLMFEVYQAAALRMAIIFFFAGALTAFLFNRKLKSDPEPNRWG